MKLCQYLLIHVINHVYDHCILSKVLMIDTYKMKDKEP